MSRATDATRGVTSRVTVVPRAAATSIVFAATWTTPLRGAPSAHVAAPVAGSPSASRGVRGEPSA